MSKSAYCGWCPNRHEPSQGERYAMKEAKVVRLVQPGEFEDALTAVLRAGARDLLAQAIEAEVEDFRSRYADQRLTDGRERLGAPPACTPRAGQAISDECESAVLIPNLETVLFCRWRTIMSAFIAPTPRHWNWRPCGRRSSRSARGKDCKRIVLGGSRATPSPASKKMDAPRRSG